MEFEVMKYEVGFNYEQGADFGTGTLVISVPFYTFIIQIISVRFFIQSE